MVRKINKYAFDLEALMNIVYASDNNFAEILGISMISLFESNRDCSEIVVYILDDGINEDNKAKLLFVAEKYDREIFFLDVSKIDVPEFVQSARWSKSAFIRLFMRKILPSNVKKVLYLDCDVIVMQQLDKLYDTNIDKYIAAGVQDCISSSYLRNLKLNNDDFYCNSGILLINMEKWNENDFMLYYDKFKSVIKYPDQDVINGIYSRKMLKLDLKYNCYTALYDFTYKDLMTFRKPKKYYSEEEVSKAKADPAIVHFTTSFLSLRPWIEGCKHPYVGEWLKYKAMSPWENVPLRKDNRSGKKKFAVKVYKALPNGLAVGIAGSLHAWIVPMMRRKK